MSKLNSVINSTYQQLLSDKYGVSCSSNIAIELINYTYSVCTNCTSEEEPCTFNVLPVTLTCNFGVEEL